MSKPCRFLYDRDVLEVEIPDHWQVLQPLDAPPIENLSEAIHQALREPIGCAPLPELASHADTSGQAVITISDITRSVPNKRFLPALIDCLLQAGFSREQIVILVATGMHRPSTDAQRLELVGPELVNQYRIVDHRADDQTTLVQLPRRTSAGTTVRIDRLYAEAAFRIVTGFIEPHFMAGYSGGRKGICPGLVDLKTIENFHGPEFLGDPKARLGVLEGNPCHREALEVAKMCPPHFLFNVTVDAECRITGIFAGELEAAHLAGVKAVEDHMTVEVDDCFDVVFTSGGGYPLDTTYYQTVKAMVTATEYVRPGGKVVVVSGCRDGIGSDIYRRIMFDYDDYKRFLADIFSSGQVIRDQWEFQMQCRTLDRVGLQGLIVATDGIATHELARCHVTPIRRCAGDGPTRQQVQTLINQLADQALSVAVLPRGPYVLPKVSNPRA